MAWEPSKHPRWPDETPGGLGGQFMEVPDLFERLSKQVSGSMTLNFMLKGGRGTPKIKRLTAKLDGDSVLVVAGDGQRDFGYFRISDGASTAAVMEKLKQVDSGELPSTSESREPSWIDPPPPRGKNKGRGGAGGYTSDAAESTLTDLGREGELLFAKLTGGEILHPPGKGEQSPLDVRVDKVAYEVKTVSADSTSYKATPKPHEVSSKEAHAKELGVEPALAIVVIDREAGVARAYSRPGLKGGRLSKNTGWMYMGEVELRGDTQQKYLGPDGQYVDERVREVHDPIIRHFLKGAKKATGTPKTLFMAGGSGSGKSTVRKKLKDAPQDAVLVDPDAIKEMLPEYREMVAEGDKRAAMLVHEESSDLAKRLLEEANKRGFNVVVDGTGDSGPGKFLGKVVAAKSLGREAKVVMVDIEIEEAIKRAMMRAKRTGRRVPPSEIKAIHEAVAQRYLEWREDVSDWEVWSNDDEPKLIARRIGGGAIEVLDPARHTRIIRKAGDVVKR